MLKRMLYAGGAAGALAGAYLLGSVMLGGAFAQTPPPPAQPTAPDQTGPQQNQPGYSGSIPVPQDQSGQSEADEAQALQSQAKITADEAKNAALTQFPGATVKKVELDNENGALVYSVQLTDASGKAQDVKVDAGNGKVLHVEADGPEGAEGHEAGGAEN